MAILCILRSKKQFTKDQFSEAIVCKCSVKRLLIKFCQSLLATLLIKGLRHRCISVKILQNTCKWLVLDFAHFHMSHSINHFLKWNIKKGNYYFLNIFNSISTSEKYRQKTQLDSKMWLFVIFSLGGLDLKSFINPIQDGLFWGCSRMEGGKKVPLPKVCHTYLTIMKLATVIPYLKEIQKIYESRDTPLKFRWHQ